MVEVVFVEIEGFESKLIVAVFSITVKLSVSAFGRTRKVI